MGRDAVQDRTRFDGDVHVGNIAYFRGAIGIGEYGLAKVVSDFIAVDLERGYECDVFYFVVPELEMH